MRALGAVGDGRVLDTAAIQRAFDAAAAEGGGTVVLPAGVYLSFSLRLRSHVALRLEAGAVLRAATPAPGFGAYDDPEPNIWDMYQDFGHSHWRNSLLWGENLENIGITGPGRIDGAGLTRRGPGPPPRGEARRHPDHAQRRRRCRAGRRPRRQGQGPG